MKKWLCVIVLLFVFAMPVSAQEFTTPAEPEHVTELLPSDRDSFAEGLGYVFRSAFAALRPKIADCARVCLSTIAVSLLISLLHVQQGSNGQTVELIGTIGISCLLMSSANALIHAAADTIGQISDYGKLLLPVLASALAAQGGATTSSALYGASIAFDALLTSLVSRLLVPMVFIYLLFSIVHGALSEQMMKRMRDVTKSTMTTLLKLLLYSFTGYVGITGIVNGTTDQSLLKAAKMTISGAVPVVGGILSDASEAVLVGAAVVKNSVGIGGLLVIIAIAILPFLQIGLQYLMLKWTAALCSLFAPKSVSDLIGDFSGAMGLLLGMTGAVCLIFLISIVCFLKGMG